MNKKTSIKKDKNHIKIKKYIKNISKGLHKIYISANGKVKVRFLDKYISDPIKINKHTKKKIKAIWKLEYFTKGVIFVSNIEMFNNHKNNHRWEPLLADRNKKLLLIVTNGNVVVRGR